MDLIVMKLHLEPCISFCIVNNLLNHDLYHGEYSTLIGLESTLSWRNKQSSSDACWESEVEIFCISLISEQTSQTGSIPSRNIGRLLRNEFLSGSGGRNRVKSPGNCWKLFRTNVCPILKATVINSFAIFPQTLGLYPLYWSRVTILGSHSS